MTSSPECRPDPARVWPVLLHAARWRRQGGPAATACRPDPASADGVATLAPDDPAAWLQCDSSNRWQPGAGLPEDCRDLVGLYLPLLMAGPGRAVTVGHLGQSVDAFIATPSGDSAVVTGAENFLHLHRMRALCDAIVVGGGTAAADDPQLTTRQVAGPNPVRVVLDPGCALPPDLRIFTDGAAPTCIACAVDVSLPAHLREQDVIRLPQVDGQLSLPALRAAMDRRQWHAVFVEGGGVTVTRWMQAGLLSRLQIAVAPLLVGAGRAALQLPSVARMRDALRPDYRLYRMGSDVLWDFDLVADRSPDTPGRPAGGLQRLY